jgi:AraC-like DNA-binding protein
MEKMYGGGGRSVWLLAGFMRPLEGPRFEGSLDSAELKLSGEVGWSSNGGPGRGHPARALPGLLELPLVSTTGVLEGIVLVGVFARWAAPKQESIGTVGGSIQFGSDESGHRLDLLNGRHYRDAFDLQPVNQLNGDGTSLHSIGTAVVDAVPCRVDALSIDLPPGSAPEVIRIRDLGSPASFTIFDVALRWQPAPGCPFHSGQGGVPLSELGSVIRLRDRVKFKKALHQLESAIQMTDDLDEARGEALTFIAVAVAATLELGAPRSMHRIQLEAARGLEQANSAAEILEASREVVDRAVGPLFDQGESPNDRLIDKALAIVDRQFARSLTDSLVADQLGLSPSHFRFLFRQATGKPFHKYLVAVRLERARQLLAEQGMQVSDVATAVGFNGLSHFSRAFTQRFMVSPTQVRNTAR